MGKTHTAQLVSPGRVRHAIRQHVLASIERGEWAVGERLPTEVDLAEQFATSRSNVNQAMKMLEDEGVVRRYRRRGTFVAGLSAAQVSRTLDQLQPHGADVRGGEARQARPRQPRSRQGRVHLVAPQPDEQSPMHYWYRAAIDELESALNADGLQVSHLSVPNRPSVSEFRAMVKQAAAEPSQAMVLMVDLQKQGPSSATGEEQQLLPYAQALLGYPGRVCWLNRAGVALTAWPYDAVSMAPLNEGIAAGQYLLQQAVSQVRCVGMRARRWSQMRILGVEMALQEAADRITWRTDWCDDTEDIEPVFEAVLDEVAQGDDRPTLVVPKDSEAARLLEMARRRGLHCPDSFCLISFGNDENFRQYNITTVARTASHLGETLGQLVSDQIRRPGGACLHMTLKSMIVERSTFASAISRET